MFPTHHHQQHQLGNQYDPHYHSNPVLKWHWKQNDWCCKHSSNRCIWLWRGRGRGARLKGLQALNASTQLLSSASSTWHQDSEEHMWILDTTNSSRIYHLFLWKTSCHIEPIWPGFFLLLWFWVLGRVRLYTGYYMWAQPCVRDLWLRILSCLPLALPHLARQRGPRVAKGSRSVSLQNP